MLTVAYCRVSTEEQAAEGFSIAGQADKLRVYAELHDLGDVTVIADPGLSGKNLERPGLQQLLHMVDEGHVANVLTWRLDRLSRNLGDLILLADRFGQAGVALHSFTEKIDLSSATGRMFYNILGSFAQFYREQLAENVRMGMQQAVRQGKWVNRPKTGYDLVDGELVPNEMAPVVRRIFTMRAEGREPGQDRRRHRRQVLDRADHPRLSHLPRRGPDERRVVPRAPRGDHHPGGNSPPPTGAGSRAGPGAPTSSRAGSAAGCASGSWPSTRTARAASSTAATTGARAAPSPAGRTRAASGRPCWGSGSSATT